MCVFKGYLFKHLSVNVGRELWNNLARPYSKESYVESLERHDCSVVMSLEEVNLAGKKLKTLIRYSMDEVATEKGKS